MKSDSKRHVARQVRVRAHFSYKAADDLYIPCKEAGLDFNKGDVLHIVSQDDPYWYGPNGLTGSFIRAVSCCNCFRLEIGGKRDARVIET